ncbi:MAG: KpsF/GutQ family sugar-phosphate isomerase, partial [Pseudomonadota bacterium]
MPRQAKSQPAENQEAPDCAFGREVLLKEADALALMASELGQEFSDAVDEIVSTTGRVICAGVGKSGHVARKIAATLSSTGTASYFVHPTEASHGDLGAIKPEDVILALSRSGETSELSDLIHYARRFNVRLIALTAVATSALGKAADILLRIPDVEEACDVTGAPTTSTTLTMALGDALAVAALRRRGFNADAFKTFHPGGMLGAMLKSVADLMHSNDALPVIAHDAPLKNAIAEMSAKGLGCVCVIDHNRSLEGVITDGDLRRLLLKAPSAACARHAMTANPITGKETDLAAAALRVMNESKITQLVVVDDANVPVGVLHLHD